MDDTQTEQIKPVRSRKRKETTSQKPTAPPVVTVEKKTDFDEKKNDLGKQESKQEEKAEEKLVPKKRARVVKPAFNPDQFADSMMGKVKGLLEEKLSTEKKTINDWIQTSLMSQDVVTQKYVERAVGSSKFNADPLVEKIESLEKRLKELTEVPKPSVDEILNQNTKVPEGFNWPLKKHLY